MKFFILLSDPFLVILFCSLGLSFILYFVVPDQNPYEVKRSMESMGFKYMLLVEMACAAVLLIENVMGYIAEANLDFSRTLSSTIATMTVIICVLTFTILCVTIGAFFYAVPQSDYLLVLVLRESRVIGVSCGTCRLLVEGDRFVWKEKLFILAPLLGCLGSVVKVAGIGVGLELLGILSFVLQGTAAITFLLYSVRYGYEVRRSYIKRVISKPELRELISVIFAVICIFVIGGTSLFYANCNFSDVGPVYLIIFEAVSVFFVSGDALYRSQITRIMKFEFREDIIKRESEMRRTLAGYFSHEIRSPLNSVFMGLQVLQRDVIDNRRTSYILDFILSLQDQSLYVVDILNDLLIYAEEEGATGGCCKPICITSFIEHVVGKSQRACAEKGVNLVFEVMQPPQDFQMHEAQRVMCNGDEEKLGQVLRKLLFNAIECTPRDCTVTVSSSMALLSPSNTEGGQDDDRVECQLSINVTDEGPGLTEEEKLTMFQKGLVFSPGVLQGSHGRCLGLWISRDIVQALGGQLSVTSEGLGTGSTFSVQLPVFVIRRNSAASSADIPSLQLRQKPMALTMRHAVCRTPSVQMVNQISSDQNLFSIRTSGEGFVCATDQSSRHERDLSVRSFTSKPYARAGSDIQHDVISDQSRLFSGPHLRDFSSSSSSSPLVRKPRSDASVLSHLESVAMSARSYANISSYSRRVLVVDDVVMNRKMLVRLLEGYCDETLQAEDGLIAVDMLRESINEGRAIDLVLMDYQMPNMDGPTAAAEMRKLGYTGPIIGVTGNALVSDTRFFLECGADRVFIKPLLFSTLTDALEDMGLSDILVYTNSST